MAIIKVRITANPNNSEMVSTLIRAMAASTAAPGAIFCTLSAAGVIRK